MSRYQHEVPSSCNTTVYLSIIYVVAKPNTYRGSTWLIWSIPLHYSLVIISLEGKPWELNGLALFCEKKLLIHPDQFPSWLVGVKNPSVAPVSSSISSDVYFSVISKKNLVPFQVTFCSLVCSTLLGHQPRWIYFFQG